MSELADLIIENGPYVVGQMMPFPYGPNGHPLITAAQLNALRDELIRLRAERAREGRTHIESSVEDWDWRA